ncbi:MAG: hypothetical protein JWL86_3589 [Rhizobium sp.]|nr:hypothetical protein [Rhizobium sp.]
MTSRGLFVTACLLSGLLSAGSAQAWTEKDIDKWNTSCSSGLTCSLRYEDFFEEFGAFEIRRTGALNSDVVLWLPEPPGFSRSRDPGGVFRLDVDSKEVLRLTIEQLKFDAEEGEFVLADKASVQILLEAMKAGDALRLSYEGVTGKFSKDMNLAGFRGSLFFIDNVQGRRGRNDALLAVGQKVPEGPDSKEIRSIDDIPASIRADFTVADGACTEGFIPDDIKRYNGFDISISGSRLVLVPCGGGGAYNQPYALYRGYYSGILSRISFPDIAEGKPSVSEVEYNVDFDPATRIMTAFLKDNGLGICGLWHKWELTLDGYLVLLEKRSWELCDDSYDGPESFPLEWPVKE